MISEQLSDPRRNRFDDPPKTVTCSLAKKAPTPKAEPVRRWQSKQWQSDTLAGSPLQRITSCPHWHAASRTMPQSCTRSVQVCNPRDVCRGSKADIQTEPLPRRHEPCAVRVQAADAQGMEDAMQLDPVGWIADQGDTPDAKARVGGASPAGPAGGCVHIEHVADARPVRRMSAHRMLVYLAVLGWSERELARRTGRHQTTIKRWTGGSGAADDGTAAWLERLVAFHLAHPAPGRKA